MQVRCQICGAITDVQEWKKEFEELKHGAEHPYICRPCQQKIQNEAKEHQHS